MNLLIVEPRHTKQLLQFGTGVAYPLNDLGFFNTTHAGREEQVERRNAIPVHFRHFNRLRLAFNPLHLDGVLDNRPLDARKRENRQVGEEVDERGGEPAFDENVVQLLLCHPRVLLGLFVRRLESSLEQLRAPRLQHFRWHNLTCLLHLHRFHHYQLVHLGLDVGRQLRNRRRGDFPRFLGTEEDVSQQRRSTTALDRSQAGEYFTATERTYFPELLGGILTLVGPQGGQIAVVEIFRGAVVAELLEFQANVGGKVGLSQRGLRSKRGFLFIQPCSDLFW